MYFEIRLGEDSNSIIFLFRPLASGIDLDIGIFNAFLNFSLK